MNEALKFPSEVPELGRRQAEEWLFAALESNAESYATDTDFGRRAAREAVLCVITFLDGRGLCGQAIKILGDLAAALIDVENRTLPEMFDPNRSIRGGADGEQVWTRSAKGDETDLYLAATAMALHRRKKMKLSEIFQKIARHASNWRRASSGIITAGRVRTVYNKYRVAAKRGEAAEFEQIVKSLCDGPNASRYLEDVLANGPPLTGGTRKQKI